MTDQDYMQMALALAARGKGFTSPNPCVGAVVVRDGTVIGEGWHKKAGTAHAEVNAIDDALGRAPEKLAGATIYVTLEPCNHYGKTPPCTRKILENGITRVVVGCNDPNPNVSGGGNDFLKDQGLEVVTGVLEDEAQELIEDFIWYVRHGRTPFVTLKCAATLDGYIATRTRDSQWITNETSRAFGHELRHLNDAILIGSGTLHADNPSLTARMAGRQTRDPIRVVLDTRLTMDADAKVINPDSEAGVIVVAAPGADPDKKSLLTGKGVQVLEVALAENRLDLRDLMLKLGRMSVTSVLIEGGGQVAASALKAGIVNKVCYFLAPKLLGGNDGVPVFSGQGPERIGKVFQLQRVRYRQMENDLLVTGYLDHGSQL